MQENLECYWNVLPIFGFSNAKYDLNLIKSYLLPILVNECNIEPTVIKKANQFISFKFFDIQLLDIMNFPGGGTSIDSFLKAYKTSDTKGFFRYEWLDHPDKNVSSQGYWGFLSCLRPFHKKITFKLNYLNISQYPMKLTKCFFFYLCHQNTTPLLKAIKSSSTEVVPLENILRYALVSTSKILPISNAGKRFLT